MKGKYEVIVQNRRLQYKFTVNRNITILRGDSATGKTTLIDMIAAYQQNGAASGITIRCQKDCTVLTGLRWQENISLIHDSIVFIDEGDAFVLSADFARAIKNSDNYYVIATRSSLFHLPYSIQEIYGIKNKAGNRYQGTKRLYAEFYPLCNIPSEPLLPPDLVLVEDTNSGFQFFSDYFSKYQIPCISAQGNSNIYKELLKQTEKTVLVIADGAAFGAEIERVLALKRVRNIILYLPESFEWLVLRSGLVRDSEITKILAEPSENIESEKYFSWERFFTALLTDKTKDTYLHYQKSELNSVYLRTAEQEAVLSVMPKWLP